MDPRERFTDLETMLKAQSDGNQSKLWTSIPGAVVSFNAGACTAAVQPALQSKKRNPDGTITNVTLPQLVDCPVIFPRGGGYTLTFPIAAGDECLIMISSRCIDSWWNSGGIQPLAHMRQHDLSDAFILVGPFSQAHKISGISTSSVQLRNNAGTEYVELAGGGIVTIKAPTKVILDTPEVHVTGKVTAVGDVTAGTISLENHEHPYDHGNTGPPNP